ncbi:MAG TPA: metallophosphoesterase [Candidatus Nanoarchaeia archaeon]|nr:metallophosphoesterase [Candidatus Nanoarchaeia archaeon]
MKLLAFTDTHNSKKALKSIVALSKKHNPDLLICCGDISWFELNLHAILKSLAALKKPIIMVNGNHEDDRHLARMSKKFRNIYFIHGSGISLGDYLFLGYGGDGFSIVDPYFLKIAKSFEKIIKKNKGKKIILLTHAPPNRTKLDKLPGGYCGNKSIRQFIEKHQPAYAFCGHIHENFGRTDRIKRTLVMNPGPFGKIVRL